MANKSEEIINCTLVVPFAFGVCFTETYYGLIFCYFIMSICILVGAPAHLWCLWLYLIFDGEIKQSQVFLLNHTIMELLSCVECAIEILNQFIFMNEDLLLMTGFLFGLSWTGRSLIQTCICIEQYIAVLHPVTFLKYKGIKYRIASAGAAWLMAFGYGVYEIYFLTFTNFIINSVFIVAVAVILFCCLSVLHALKRPGPGDTHVTSQTGSDFRNQQKKNAFNIIFSVLLINLLTFVPLGLISIFTVVNIYWVVLYCNVAPFLSSLSMFSLIITPVLKMNKEGYLKTCRNHGNNS